MRIRTIISCLLVLGISVSLVAAAGAMGKAPKKAGAASTELTTVSSSQSLMILPFVLDLETYNQLASGAIRERSPAA